jgi:hypothetical protein
MPLQGILKVELFDLWGINFMGLFSSSCNNKYIIVAVNYISKWVEAVSSPTIDSKVVQKLFKRIIFKGGTKTLQKDHFPKVWCIEGSD